MIEYTHNYKSTYFYFDNTNYYDEKIFSKCLNESIEEILSRCNFKKRLKLCTISESNPVKIDFGHIYINDIIYSTKAMNIVINMFMVPILCFVCILANLLVIFVLKKENKQKDKFYEYLRIMSWLNALYCFIVPYQLISFCVFQGTDYCSSIYKSVYTQYVYIVFVKMIGNMVKTCMYWSNVSFTMSRYLKISGHKGKWLARLDQISVKKYFFFSFLFSFLLNLSIFFEYSVHQFTFYQNFVGNDFYQYPFYSSKDYFFDGILLKYKPSYAAILLDVIHYVRILLNDVFFLVFNFVFDVVLFIFLRKTEAKKLQLTKTTNEEQHLTFKQKKLALAKKRLAKVSKNKIKAYVIFNSLNFFLFKLTFIAFSLVYYIFSYDEYSFSFAENRLLCSLSQSL